MSFSGFVEMFLQNPEKYLKTSSTLIADAIKHFGYKIVIRSGEPVVSFDIFKDNFSNGVNAVYGQEKAIKKLVDVIESISKESGPNRGIVLMGPPASGKTNIIDLIALALEEYSKSEEVKLYSFFYQFVDHEDPSKTVEIRPAFTHNPLLLFTTILQKEGGIIRPRQELFEFINSKRPEHEKIVIPSYYQNASLDKRNLDIVESLIQNARNKGKSLYDIFEEYVRVEEIEFANAQAQGISNIDDMNKLEVKVHPVETRDDALRILNQHLPTKLLYRYDGALVASNRGMLHIHDAFSANVDDMSYRPLLMLLGSGKASLESTQTFVDTIVVITTNLEDMEKFDRQLTSTKLLDRIEKIPVNYLLDASSEIDILKRDMSIIKEKYDVDPNLFKVSAYYSVMTRLLPPARKTFPENWSDDKKNLYNSISPEQKLMIYSCKPVDPVHTIRKLPYWHPFRNQASKLGIDLYDEEKLTECIEQDAEAQTLENCSVFSNEQLSLIDDDFMRTLRSEYNIEEGRNGISIRQLQNIMRNTISNSNGRTVVVNTFLEELEKTIEEGVTLHHWLALSSDYKKNRKPIQARKVGDISFKDGEGDYGDFRKLIKVIKAIYHLNIRKEIITATVDRDPIQIESDLRRYIQYAMLAQALENKAFSHIMVPKFSFIDPVTGEKVDRPDYNFMDSIEKIICLDKKYSEFRRVQAQKFFDMVDAGKLTLEKGKTIINSRNDNFVVCYEKENSLLISHRRTEEGIDAEVLAQSFFVKQKDSQEYLKLKPEIRKFTETILHNMVVRFGYSHNIALETIVFALREDIVDFKKVLH